MKFTVFLISFIFFFCVLPALTLAHDNVVVVPLGKKPSGDATVEDVLDGKTFSNSSATGLTGRRPPAPVERTHWIGSYGVVWPSPRFSAGKYVVTDNLTGIMWQKSANNGEKSWDLAIGYCNNLELFVGDKIGYIAKDWRLPNVKELQSLVDFGEIAPSVSNTAGTGKWSEGNPFTDVRASFYWTASTHEYFSNEAWFVFFWDGTVDNAPKSDNNYVWCMRGVE